MAAESGLNPKWEWEQPSISRSPSTRRSRNESQPNADRAAVPSESEAASPAVKRVLVVDDDRGIREAVSDYLSDHGYLVLTAGDGEGALRLAAEKQPDLVLLDVGLPDMSGFEVCKRLRAMVESRHIPIIMLTAHALERDEVRGFRSGADDYVTKPFKPVRLLARVNSAIERNRRGLDANALTHLPGNQVIMDEIDALIKGGGPFSVLYFDLNNFKAFNDRYGFIRGDEAIKVTADILTRAFSDKEKGGRFLGHIGGDDFVGTASTQDARALCERVIQEFDRAVADLYDDDDRRRGGIVTVDRKGVEATVPIMGLAIAVVTNQGKRFEHPGEIALIAGDLKKWAKSENGSTYVIDRRN